MNDYSYIGTELEFFKEAVRWKSYYRDLIRNYLTGDVLEVGAGVGSTTQFLISEKQKRWVCMEPDAAFVEQIHFLIRQNQLPHFCQARHGVLQNLDDRERFDVILYIDVLEHIELDKSEMKLAAAHLNNEGKLIVISPAHQWLFSPFDHAIGHFRRYNKAMLFSITPENLRCVKIMYLDCVGLFASLTNRLILKKKMPDKKQILFWDRFLIPISRKVDPILGYSVGKSILSIWSRG
jgi:spermidine synthase